MTQTLLWIAIGLIVYTYAGFPLLLLVRGLVSRRPVARGEVTPRVSMVIVAHDEAEVIEAKLENVYALEYPRDLLEVIVASDGSGDGTNEIVKRFADRGVRLLELPRKGKIPALNAAAERATGEVLVFSDANSMYAPDALRKLVAPFADPQVGAVGGNQCYVPAEDGHTAGVGERLYWRFDRLLKTLQSRAGSMTSATGAMHAIYWSLFRPVPSGVNDDLFTSTRAVARGYRLVFARDAIAFESVAGSNRAEFDRKQRIMARALRSLWTVRGLFNPLRYGFYSLQLFSHKFLRFSVGWLLLVVLGTSLLTYPLGGIYPWLVYAQLVFYLTALAAHLLGGTRAARSPYFKLLAIPFYVCLSYYAALRAWVQVFSGKRVDIWDSRPQAHENSLGAAAGEIP